MRDARRPTARHLRRISDLARHPGLRLGLSHEFLGRARRLAGPQARLRPAAAAASGSTTAWPTRRSRRGEIDVIDIYSTDAKIARYGLRVLEDDRGFFPQYDAVLLYRADLPQRFPRAWRRSPQLEGTIDARRMIGA